MSNILWKNFLCFTKFKRFPTNLSPPQTSDTFDEQDETFLHINPTNQMKNFNSIYDIPSGSTSKSITCSTEDLFSSSNDSENGGGDTTNVPDFSTVLASQRFFFSDPGESNSITEEPGNRNRPVMKVETPIVLSGGVSVAVNTLSPDPYADFRRSMQEMVEANGLRDVKGNWDFLHELLLCYLSLNPEHTHKLIIGAFTDLIVSLMARSTGGDHSRRTTVGRHISIARLLM